MTLQEQYEELATRLCEITAKRKKIEAKREFDTRALREELRNHLSAVYEDYHEVLALETEFRQRLAALYAQAKGVRDEAYQKALKAQAEGDMEAVKQATLEAGEAALTPTANVFFRTKIDHRLENIDLVPAEFLTVDWSKVEASKEPVPGIVEVELPVIVVASDKGEQLLKRVLDMRNKE